MAKSLHEDKHSKSPNLMRPPLNPLYYEAWFACSSTSLPDEFFIITANNPNGRTVSNSENEKLNSDLIMHLDCLGLDYFEVAAGSKDRCHVEASYAVASDLKTGLILCNKYEQDAIFWVSSDRLSIVKRDGLHPLKPGRTDAPIKNP
eukprot:GHVU01101276.1.p1 GENE.GHVU01101276.1~~GHVU01101276.1.p1  ORF type:complete len:147 (+),score=5.97 GHVU01101276.1:374-814(+)